MKNKAFLPNTSDFGKQFAFSLDAALAYTNIDPSKVAIIQATIGKMLCWRVSHLSVEAERGRRISNVSQMLAGRSLNDQVSSLDFREILQKGLTSRKSYDSFRST